MNANSNQKYYYAFFALALCGLIIPLYLVEIPPLVDLPNHLARIFILVNYDKTPFFQQNFQVIYEPIPNMAMDLIMVPLLYLFDIFTANRLFLTLTVVLFALGCHLTGVQKTGNVSFSAIHAAFLIYSGTFFYGFINYVFGVALFLITFGLWLRWREKFRFTYFLTLVGLTSALFVAHLSAFAFFGIAVLTVNVYDYLIRPEEKRKWTFYAAYCALFTVPTIAFLVFMKGSGQIGTGGLNSSMDKAVALFSAFRSYDLWLDLLCVAVLAALCFWLKRRGEINFDKRILSVALIFLLIFLLSPKYFFTGDGDSRIVLPGFVLLILSCRINVLTSKTFTLLVVTICLFTFRQAIISYRWIQMAEKMTAERNLLDVIEPQSKVYPLFVNDSSNSEEKYDRPIQHAVHYATIKNSSIAPTLLANRGQNSLVFRQPRSFATLDNEDEMKWIQYLYGYDYVWTFGVPQNVSDELEKRGKIAAVSGKTKIWKLNK